jgi:ABC-type lipoprotein release transport system permease subunit
VAIAATIGILLATGMLAALSPAQRAARVDPATLLRRE